MDGAVCDAAYAACIELAQRKACDGKRADCTTARDLLDKLTGHVRRDAAITFVVIHERVPRSEGGEERPCDFIAVEGLVEQSHG